MPVLIDYGNSLGLAFDCLATLSRYPDGPDTLLGRARAYGDELVGLVKSDAKNRTGWPFNQNPTEPSKKCGQPGSLDAFGDGTCNPPETPYMLQTGYAVACLAQLYITTGEAKYVHVARKALSDSWNLGGRTSGCHDCFYYWYSYHSNDLNRYVRNTNLAMGLGIAWMYAATGDPDYRDRSLAIAKAEHYEIVGGNFGYFGVDDQKYRANPKLESQGIENHILLQVKGLKDISKIFGNYQALEDAKALLNSYLNCRNERCRKDNCLVWAVPPSCKSTATIAPCILADQGEPYKSLCETVLRVMPQLNSFQIFLHESTSEVKRLQRR